MDSWLGRLEQKKFLVVTGKGGTGKSTLSAALALYFSGRGKSVLLAEIGRVRDRSFLRLNDFFPQAGEFSTKPITVANPLRVRKSLSVCCIDPSEALVEYIGLKLKSQKLAEVVLKNRIAFSFLDTIPGLTELVSLGKLWHEATRDGGPDIIILDAPASGHAMAMLLAPKNFAELTRMGPLYRDALAMQTFFSDPEQNLLLYCSLPEEVPFQETVEFSTLIAKEGLSQICLVNKCFPLHFRNLTEKKPPPDSSPLKISWEYAQNRSRNEAEEMDRYRSLSKETAFIPFVPPDGENEKAHLELARSWLGEKI